MVNSDTRQISIQNPENLACVFIQKNGAILNISIDNIDIKEYTKIITDLRNVLIVQAI